MPFSHYDQRGYRTVEVVEGYRDWSQLYADFDDRFDIDLLGTSSDLAEQLSGGRVADLACGTGRIGRWARSRGAAEVAGVDLSPDMLREAESLGGFDQLSVGDMTRTGLESGGFDVVLNSMALCHVRELHAFYTEAVRILGPGGLLAIVDYHPHFLLLGIPSHFDHPETGESIAVENTIHTHSAHFRLAQKHGLSLRAFEERFVTQRWVDATPGYARYLGLPFTWMMVFSRGA